MHQMITPKEGSTKQRLLLLLKSRGTLSLSDIAKGLGITKQAALKHLMVLIRQGLVQTYQLAHPGRGRPSHFYKLTPEASKLFPHGDEELIEEILTFIKARFGEHALEEFFNIRKDVSYKEFQERAPGLSFEARVKLLAEMASEKGYMASVEKLGPGTYIIKQENCPLARVAKNERLLCESEMETYAACLGASIKRTEFIMENGPRCSYLVRALKRVQRATSR
jgi:predicted ArsR family transcriptional regulator